ncbi:MAG: HAMP domain-containing protein, partial [Anaerolineae bacterium]|nr:HAMP domain-containing protein [Anaerolineae bacterium]
MKQNHSRPESVSIQRSPLNRLISSIGTKIILPYLILTLIVAGVGAFIVVRLVAGSLQERFNNQLLDAGRIVSEEMVKQEIERLSVLQSVISTQGVAESLAAKDKDALAKLVPQIIANNNNTDAVELLDLDGQEIMGWQRPPNQSGTVGQLRSGSNYAEIEDVQRVLKGIIDEFGERRTLIGQTPNGLMIFTIGPVYQGETRVGAAMVGTYLSEEVKNLTDVAAAKITFYDTNGSVLETSLAGERQEIDEVVEQVAPTYEELLSLLRESPTRYPVIASTAENEVQLERVTVLGQEYTLAYGDWRLRNQSIGFFSVALPNNFIVSTAATSRNVLSLLFSVATIFVFVIGFVIAQRIIRPLNKLVQTSLAITQGNLSQRTGITRNDEIGSLASSFDVMTDKLERRNRELVEQASKLETILNST